MAESDPFADVASTAKYRFLTRGYIRGVINSDGLGGSTRMLLRDYCVINKERLLRDFKVSYLAMLGIPVVWALRRYVATRLVPTPFEVFFSIVGSGLAAAAFVFFLHTLAAYLVVIPLARRRGMSVADYLKSSYYQGEKYSELKRPVDERIGQ